MNGLLTLLSLIGLKPNMARIIAILLLSNKALSLSEVCNATGYAKSRVSEIMRILEAKGLVEVSIVKKKAYYKVRVEALRKHIEEHLERLARSLEEAHRESGVRDFMEIAEAVRRLQVKR
ncbi:helix-turn-helix domain-containing protein [Desulfurococcus mucosus]|uniref:Regulatory protein ArsR n=1 Tax=Desulfurococcus mucosus (strain ATCC 35584 / DSM 2162 / JCM 9187 / O7/1) TaxID=765177 RepID=E8R8T1_DESM0|nr:helix-turn-helix domain-containing protein [Desulfurococcus mucosus]ADV64907.1 regulatory protein ArsR [Desulfurococcus mucosus DSM 2162]